MIEEEKNLNRLRIGQAIAAIRKEKGLTQEQLSQMTGLDRANIGKIENGRYNVSIDILGKICEALGCRIDIVEE